MAAGLRRLLPWSTLALLLALLAAAGHGWQQWQRLQREQGIVRLDWHGLALTRGGLRLQRLQIEQQHAGRRLQLVAEGLALDWQLQLAAAPSLHTLDLQRLQLDWLADNAAPDGREASRGATDTARRPALPTWLPRRVHLRQFVASLPCASGQCRLQGALELQRPQASVLPLAFVLHLQRQPHAVQLHGNLHGTPAALALQLDLALDRRPRARLHSRLDTSSAGQHWEGRLVAAELPEAAWLQAWLGEWIRLPEPPLPTLPTLPGSLQVAADWQLQTAGSAFDAQALRRGDGRLQLDLQLPTPWPLPELGLLQGRLQLDLHGQAGHWQARQLHADLQLTQPQGAWWQRLPAELRPQTLHLRLHPATSPAVPPGRHRQPTAPPAPAATATPPSLHQPPAAPPATTAATTPLALQLALSGHGTLDFTLAGELRAWLRPDWALQLHDGRLQIDAARLRAAALEVRALQADLRLDARLARQTLDARLQPGAQLRAGQLQASPAGLRLERLHGELAGLQLQAALAPDGALDWQLHGPLALRVERLQHARLQEQGWHGQGRLTATAQTLQIDGRLGNDAGLALNLQLHRPANGTLQIAATLADIDLQRANPLAATLRDWPPLLELNRGQLKAGGQLQLPPGGAPKADLRVHLLGVGGLYDRFELLDLETHPRLQLHGRQLSVAVPELRLARLNPGVPFGPLRLRADYRAGLAQPLAGRLHLWQLDSDLLGGQLQLRPAVLELARRPLALTLQLRGLALGELLRIYPAQGLAGSGTLDGELPLRLARDGWHVAAGRLAARPPGGVLQLRSPRIRAFAADNPALRLATAALEDFRYDRLESRVSYAPQGQLLLAMRLHGSNPSLESGRPVNLTVNLEEDVPSLLTSLQLSGRVNEAIQRRVQQRLQPRH